jgi:hypothetical protein
MNAWGPILGCDAGPAHGPPGPWLAGLMEAHLNRQEAVGR